MTNKEGLRWYTIVVEPEIKPDEARLFPGLRVTARGGQTSMSGVVADQGQLGQILSTLEASDLMLVSIKRSDEPDA